MRNRASDVWSKLECYCTNSKHTGYYKSHVTVISSLISNKQNINVDHQVHISGKMSPKYKIFSFKHTITATYIFLSVITFIVY